MSGSYTSRIDSTALSSLLPQAVIQFALENRTKNPPLSQKFSTVALFADVSGFTNLSEAFAAKGPQGAEELAFFLNRYMEQLVKNIASAGGDVFKFAGDAMLVLWVPDGSEEDVSQDVLRTMAHRAIHASLKIQEELHQARMTNDVELSVKIGIGVGVATVLHVGGVYERFEYFACGIPLLQAFQSEECAVKGDVIISDDVLKLCHNLVDTHKTKNEMFHKVLSLRTGVRMRNNKQSRIIDDMHDYKLLLKRYIPAAVLPYLTKNDQKSWSGELRMVSVLFINVGVNLSSVKTVDRSSLQWLQEVVECIQKSVYRYEGSLNKFLVDDKGSNVIAAFGVPPLAHYDDPTRAVLAALKLHRKLQGKAIRCCIGVTSGLVYTGLLGSTSSREYGVLGDAVNLAARLMAKQKTECMESIRAQEEINQVQRGGSDTNGGNGSSAASPSSHVSSKHRESTLSTTSTTNKSFKIKDGVLIDSETQLLIPHYAPIRFEKWDSFKVKGKNIPVTAYTPRYTEKHVSHEPDLNHFYQIGSTKQLALVEKQWKEAMNDCQGFYVLLESAIGSGKTFFLEALTLKLQSVHRVKCLWGKGFEYMRRSHLVWHALFTKLLKCSNYKQSQYRVRIKEIFEKYPEGKELEPYLSLVNDIFGSQFLETEKCSNLDSSEERFQKKVECCVYVLDYFSNVDERGDHNNNNNNGNNVSNNDTNSISQINNSNNNSIIQTNNNNNNNNNSNNNSSNLSNNNSTNNNNNSISNNSNNQPLLVLVIDNLQWMKDDDWNLTESLVKYIRDGKLPKLTLLLAGRPMFSTLFKPRFVPPPAQFGRLRDVFQQDGCILELRKWDMYHVKSFLCEYFAVDDMHPAVSSFVFERSGGSPAFTEWLCELMDVELSYQNENVTMLNFRPESSGTVFSEQPLQYALPIKVHTTLIGYIDRLTPSQILLLKTASTICMAHGSGDVLFDYQTVLECYPVTQYKNMIDTDLVVLKKIGIISEFSCISHEWSANAKRNPNVFPHNYPWMYTSRFLTNMVEVSEKYVSSSNLDMDHSNINMNHSNSDMSAATESVSTANAAAAAAAAAHQSSSSVVTNSASNASNKKSMFCSRLIRLFMNRLEIYPWDHETGANWKSRTIISLNERRHKVKVLRLDDLTFKLEFKGKEWTIRSEPSITSMWVDTLQEVINNSIPTRQEEDMTISMEEGNRLFGFQCGFFRDVVYGLMLLKQRQQLHEKIEQKLHRRWCGEENNLGNLTEFQGRVLGRHNDLAKKDDSTRRYMGSFKQAAPTIGVLGSTAAAGGSRKKDFAMKFSKKQSILQKQRFTRGNSLMVGGSSPMSFRGSIMSPSRGRKRNSMFPKSSHGTQENSAASSLSPTKKKSIFKFETSSVSVGGLGRRTSLNKRSSK